MTGRKRIKVRRARARGWRPALAVGRWVLFLDRFPAGEPVCHPRPVCFHVTRHVIALRIWRVTFAALGNVSRDAARACAVRLRGPIYVQGPAR